MRRPSKLREIQEKSLSTVHSRCRATPRHPSHATAVPTYDSDFPKIFHILWTGPFRDKPYLALLFFLFTQKLGLHLLVCFYLASINHSDQFTYLFCAHGSFYG
ncbi:expressed protein [Phakopsora pachyrhizi]|uniref:Expressed protein n=1 Tax=Phakopsora pachyrhizi TaxID=170000 RepID=A0AAV0BJF0_PHAPC|nr:expressed protein [Phakopsora pachyrhizi]